MLGELGGGFSLRKGRVHEVEGSGAAAFTAVLCAGTKGDLIWIAERREADTLNPLGLAAFFDPSRLLVVRVPNQTEALAVMEEALRDGAAALVAAEFSGPVDFREGRRLQLAAGVGGATGLCLIPEGAGANAAETRWHAAPLRSEDGSTLMRWRLIKNKSGTFGAWDVRWDAAAHRLDVVSPSGERQGPAGRDG
ncbi:MAG: ImuA family protein [Pikeienuella sp.]